MIKRYLSRAMIVAACSATLAMAQPGATTAEPYSEADVQYGKMLQAKIDVDRAWANENDMRGEVIEPFRVVGDLYWFGTYGSGGALVRTPEGLVMIDFAWQDDVADKVIQSLEEAGFKLSDVKYFLATENHGDHTGGVARIIEESGAKLLVMEGDEEDIESGARYPAAKVDEVISDGYQLKFGGKVFTAYHIKGHTKGSTTWYWQETENGQTFNVADVCCWFVPRNVVSDPEFPTELLRENWQVLKSLPVDVPFPGIHTWHFNTYGKVARVKAGEDRLGVMVDPQGYRGVIASFERDFEEKVVQQLKDGPPPPREPR